MLRKRNNKTRKSRTLLSRSRTLRSRRRQTVKRRKMRGGYGPGAPPYGSPLVTAYPNTWPGVAGHAGQSNYYPLSGSGIPSGLPVPPISTTNTISSASKLTGGGKIRRNKGKGMSSKMRGGGVLQEITNTTRGLLSSLVHTANSFAGVTPHVSSYPSSTMQPIGQRNIDFVKPSMPPDIFALHRNAGQQVARF
jgi:hypothetical protein